MPRKPKPSIIDELLVTRLSELDGKIHITPAQLGLLLGGRSLGQLADDRVAGKPPPFAKIHGSIRYRLDKVRELLDAIQFRSTADSSDEFKARAAGLGHRTFSAFIQHAEATSSWPFTMRSDGLPMNLFDSLGTEGKAKWLSLYDYLTRRTIWATHKQLSKEIEPSVDTPSRRNDSQNQKPKARPRV